LEALKKETTMTRKRGFTLIELLVVTAVIVLLMGILMPVLGRAREQGRRIACLNRLKQLSMAWRLYADDNRGRMVNAVAGFSDYASIGLENETAWVGQWWKGDILNDEYQARQGQVAAIKSGALWPYVAGLDLYRCPTPTRGLELNYSIMDAMNGWPQQGTDKVSDAHVKCIYDVSRPSQRLVFIDEGWVTPASFAVHYEQEQWWDQPPVRHGSGTNVSLADGHCTYWQWESQETLGFQRTHGSESFCLTEQPETPMGLQDLHEFQKATWGSLGYSPSE
jgi:prepilin-type N-terminal cleavage/methylation domain-containing protein/prepilin-type processing-associated H-X9-DG protein